MRGKLWLAIVVAALAVSSAGAAAAETISVMIKGLKFTPAEITVHVGDTIVWTNQDFVAHTATARDKAWDVMVPAGKSGSLKIETASDAEYFCRFHPMMKGKISAAN